VAMRGLRGRWGKDQGEKGETNFSTRYTFFSCDLIPSQVPVAVWMVSPNERRTGIVCFGR